MNATEKIRNETEGIDKLLINTRAARFLNALSVNLKLSEHPDYLNRLLAIIPKVSDPAGWQYSQKSAFLSSWVMLMLLLGMMLENHCIRSRKRLKNNFFYFISQS